MPPVSLILPPFSLTTMTTTTATTTNHGQQVLSLCFSADGWALAVGHESALSVWSTEDGTRLVCTTSEARGDGDEVHKQSSGPLSPSREPAASGTLDLIAGGARALSWENEGYRLVSVGSAVGKGEGGDGAAAGKEQGIAAFDFLRRARSNVSSSLLSLQVRDRGGCRLAAAGTGRESGRLWRCFGRVEEREGTRCRDQLRFGMLLGCPLWLDSVHVLPPRVSCIAVRTFETGVIYSNEITDMVKLWVANSGDGATSGARHATHTHTTQTSAHSLCQAPFYFPTYTRNYVRNRCAFFWMLAGSVVFSVSSLLIGHTCRCLCRWFWSVPGLGSHRFGRLPALERAGSPVEGASGETVSTHDVAW